MLNFLLAFGLLGLICVPFIIMFLVYGEDLSHKLVGAIVILLVWLILAGGITLDAMNKADSWNDGYCDCGTRWELRGATKSRTGTETKYYACPNCHAEIKL
jgi:hypothetical protein